ncbi:secreted aspartic proteinase precursor [Xylariomycetidae sp. FL2044]|nr:secreted aspartic proteinase precursor [Xylariomycetidae sp. FL2044]
MANLTMFALMVALWAFLLSTSTAFPFSPLGKSTDSTLSIPITHNIKARRHGPTEYLRTLTKYNLPIPDGLREAVDSHHLSNKVAAGDEDGTVPTSSFQGDLMWLTNVGIGTPPQIIPLDLDTGSADTWTFSTDTANSSIDGQTLWDPKKSSTAKLIDGCKWSIIYGDFSNSKGICYTDTLMLGDLVLENMTIESATSTSFSFSDIEESSGIVGLAWPNITQSTPPQMMLLDHLQASLKSPLFTVDMVHNGTGSFDFGYINDTRHNTDIQYVGVDRSHGYWGVRNTGFLIEGSNMVYEYATPQNVIIDTGTTIVLAPDAAVDTYFSLVPGAKFDNSEYAWTVPCGPGAPAPPDFTYIFGDDAGNKIHGVVPGEYMVYAHVSDEMCFAAMQSFGSSGTISGIFGDTFLKTGLAVFDIGQQRFGFANKLINTSDRKKK